MLKDHVLALALLGLTVSGCQLSAPTPSPSPPSTVPRRVVSLVPSATELIYQVGAGDALVGVTLNDTFPPQVAELPKVGDQTIDPERLLALQPDLVVLDTQFNADAPRYQRLGLPVLALQSRRLADVQENLRLLGSRLGHKDQGEAAARKFEEALKSVPKLNRKEKVFIEIWGSPLMTVGGESLPDDLLQVLGLENAYADQRGYFQVDPEDVVSRAPGIIVLPSADKSERSAAAGLLKKAGIPVEVIVLDGDLFTNPTPRVLEGLEILSGHLAAPKK